MRPRASGEGKRREMVKRPITFSKDAPITTPSVVSRLAPRRFQPLLVPRGQRRRGFEREGRVQNFRERHIGRRQRPVHDRGASAERGGETRCRELVLEASHGIWVGRCTHQGDAVVRVQESVQESSGAPPVRLPGGASAHDGPIRTHLGGGAMYRRLDVLIPWSGATRRGLAYGVVHRP